MRTRRVILGLLAALALGAAGFPQDPPNDPIFDASPLPGATNEQWDLSSDRGISADRAWPLSTGAGITIADVDVGVQLDHPDLRSQWAPGGHDFYSVDDDPTSDTHNEHGTNVAGVLAAAADNGIGVAGVAPGARILPLRTSDNILHQGSRLAEAIVYASDHGATVISMSLGADSFTRGLRDAVRYAHRHGVVMVVASGNEFHFHHHQPQVLPEVLAVGGVNPDTANLAARDQRLAVEATNFTVKAAYGDFGPHLDVVAPTQVPTTTWGGGYRMTWDGTSAATPHVAGVAALVQARAKALGLRVSADQVMQIIRGTADDLTDETQGFKPGWDQLSGYGRVDAVRAVQQVAPGTIPPEARLDEPFIYSPHDAPFTVAGVAGGTWRLEIGVGEEPTRWTTVAAGRAPIARARVNPTALTPGGYTLRLSVTDAAGNHGEDRSFFTALAPRGQRLLALGTSGESSPQLADVDGDRRPDVALATSDGTVRVLDGRTLKAERGWPRHSRRVPYSKPTAARIGAMHSGFLATPAIGDVAGDRRPEVIAADLNGRVYAWSSRGRLLRGFPYRIKLARPGHDDRGSRLDAAIYATPALADLDGDGKLDIVFGAADQHVYAISGRGRDLPGWPVLARDTPQADVAKILSSPAIGDLDGDGKPDVVEGTAEAYGSTPQTTGRVYAFDHAGRRLPGWPIHPEALSADAIPLVGEGVPMSPVLADVDGDDRDEVAIAAFTGTHELFGGDGKKRLSYTSTGRGGRSPASAPGVVALGVNAAFGRLQPGGPLGLFGGAVDAQLITAQLSPASRLRFEHLMTGWDAASGDWLAPYPRAVEGWQIASAPAIADVSGDGRPEVIAGSSGNVLHAVSADGSEPPGWPKPLGGWLLAAPAAGDIDGDGRNEVVAVSRDGYLYVFDTPGRPSAQEWPVFRHDARNTGRYTPP